MNLVDFINQDIEKLVEATTKEKTEELTKSNIKVKITVEYPGKEPIVLEADLCEINIDNNIQHIYYDSYGHPTINGAPTGVVARNRDILTLCWD